jgi:hypothetical protein
MDWQERLRAAVAETLRYRAARRDLRRELDARRRAGLTARHREKLARNRQEDTMPNVPPCCRESPDRLCPQHEQQSRVTRHVAIKPRGGRGHRVIGEEGKARPLRDTEETA